MLTNIESNVACASWPSTLSVKERTFTALKKSPLTVAGAVTCQLYSLAMDFLMKEVRHTEKQSVLLYH